jgi:glutathione S-transferase
VPPFAQGLVRDLRVRWALEEAGLDYEERLIGPEDQGAACYRALQPFGQVPAFQEDGLFLFESGAIVFHIAERTEILTPRNSEGRARMLAWMFAALNTIEPPIQNLAELDLFPGDEEVKAKRRPELVEGVKKRLAELSGELEGCEYLVENRFSAADLMMTAVLRILRHTDLVAQTPNLEAYRLRCEARPAFQKALADQMAPFAENAPDGA